MPPWPSKASRSGAEGSAPDPKQAEGPLSTTGLEVLACIAFKQPLSLPEINRCFSSDKRAVVHRLQHLGLVDCREAGETGRTVWMTAGEFLRRLNLPSPAYLCSLLGPSGLLAANGLADCSYEPDRNHGSLRCAVSRQTLVPGGRLGASGRRKANPYGSYGAYTCKRVRIPQGTVRAVRSRAGCAHFLAAPNAAAGRVGQGNRKMSGGELVRTRTLSKAKNPAHGAINGLRRPPGAQRVVRWTRELTLVVFCPVRVWVIAERYASESLAQPSGGVDRFHRSGCPFGIIHTACAGYIHIIHIEHRCSWPGPGASQERASLPRD